MMKPVYDTYPVFEANQILSNLHLNQLFDYLGEQERLTRANLVGIGIVCGLELRRGSGPSSVHVSRGCGVTSAGYLIVEQDAVELVAYREYTLPPELDYPPFRGPVAPHAQYPLWELFPAGEDGTTPLDTPAGFLDDKAVLLLLELKQEGLRNCSPNDCNDRGSQVTGTVRRLLVRTGDLAAIIASGESLDGSMSVSDLETAMSDRLNLPDLRLPRYDAPNTAPATSEQVLGAFHALFRGGALAARAGQALGAAWDVFKPLLQEEYPANPFAGFGGRFGFLDTAPQNATQVLFLQYYHDFFDDLIRAYDEFRWKGVELVCACTPSGQLFPRHLMLGVLAPASVSDPGLYRHGFAPACAGDALVTEFKLLFRRLVGMVDSFTDAPPLPPPSNASPTDPQLRITPSASGTCPLAGMALPYYYRIAGPAPLFGTWSPERARRKRANQTLGYRSDEYTPAAPPFVREPLRYDLAPYDFLRIEGHLGKNYQAVLRDLLALKAQYRLPIDIVSMRTGAFDESAPLPVSETARFQDLETLYDTLRESLQWTLCEGVRYLYDVATGVKLPGAVPKLPLLARYAPGFVAKPDTVGAWYERNLASLQSRPYIDVDQDRIDANAVFLVYCVLFANASPQLPEGFYAHVASVYYLSKLSEAMPDSLDALAFADFENKYQDLIGLTRYLRDDVRTKLSPDLQKFIPAEELIDHFDQVLYSCNLAPIKALHEEYRRRTRELRQKLFLGRFLQQHPGIQHKAGVPMGGTFILVYHGKPPAPGGGAAASAGIMAVSAATRASAAVLSAAVERIAGNRALSRDPDLRFLLGTLTGVAPGVGFDPAPAANEADRIIAAAVAQLAPGAVIADFFLPYLCCGEGAGVQYVLPPEPLGLAIALGCTNEADNAEAVLTPDGGLAPITYQLDSQPYQLLAGPVLLSSGPHTLRIRDSAGAESAPQSLTVPSALRLGEPGYTDDLESLTWQVSFLVSGGTLPYTADSGSIAFNRFTSAPVPSGQALAVTITDAAGCSASGEFSRVIPVCGLPCGGIASRCGYRFWLPDPDRARPYDQFASEVAFFRFEFPPGNQVDIRDEVARILRAPADALNEKFDDVARGWIEQINRVIARVTDSTDWLTLGYERGENGMPILWIESFECLSFEFHVQTIFARPQRQERLSVVHSPPGTTYLQEESGPVSIPAFDCSMIEKCHPERPVTPMCTGPDMGLHITATVRGEINVSVEAVGEQPVAFLWEVQDCRQMVAAGPRAVFTLADAFPPTKLIRVSAFTAEGCMVVALSSFTIG